jgi:hypothetical protein
MPWIAARTKSSSSTTNTVVAAVGVIHAPLRLRVIRKDFTLIKGLEDGDFGEKEIWLV